VYSSLFGPYPFEKFGFNESEVGGGMEHQTNVSLGSGFINGAGNYEWLYVHELSHMWWGDMVTLVDWRHCWLNEGFATYSEALWWEHLYGMPGLKTYVTSLQNQYISWEAGGHLYPMFDPPLQYLFSTTTYEKGACVLHMLRFLIGDSLFFASLQAYGQTYKYKNASSDDFKNSVESVSGEALDWFFDQWVYGGGSPRFYFTVFKDSDTDSFSLLSMSESNTEIQYQMPCEVLFVSGSDSLVDTITIQPYETEFDYLLSGALDGITWDNFRWILNRGFIEQLPELEFAIPGDGKVDLFWSYLYESVNYSYNIFYTTDTTGIWTKANPTPVDTNFYSVTGLTNSQVYYFRITALNGKGFESDSSNILSAQPLSFPMDRGLLVIDETIDGSGGSPILPTDQMVDSFYDYCISPVMYSQWDCASQGLPPFDTIIHYGQIIWHDDDMGYSTINQLENELINYCYNGGGFILSGWRTFHSFTTPMDNFFGAENTSEIALPLFKGVYGGNTYPDVMVDSLKMLPSWNGMLNYGWHFDNTKGDVISFIQSPDTLYDSLVTGIRNLSGAMKYVVIGFPLYFMEIEDAKTFLQKALVDIGAGIGEEAIQQTHQLVIGKPYPEPFKTSTCLTLMLPHPERVTVQVFDVTGRKVRDVYQGILTEGTHTFNWRGRDNRGRLMASAIYFIRIETESTVAARKVVFLR
jgi:hypothetical protein